MTVTSWKPCTGFVGSVKQAFRRDILLLTAPEDREGNKRNFTTRLPAGMFRISEECGRMDEAQVSTTGAAEL